VSSWPRWRLRSTSVARRRRPTKPGSRPCFGHAKGEWPHLEKIRDPGELDLELDRVRPEYNAVRLHASIGYVTPDDEHEGRGEAIRQARRDGMEQARQTRIDYRRTQRQAVP